jgi:hypothetical protein
VTGHRDGSVRTQPAPENQLIEIACDESGYEGGPSGPLHGNAHGQLVDKAFFLVSKVVDLLVEDVLQPGTGDQPAAVLYREGRRSLDPEHWNAFLEASNNLMRSKNREDVETSVDSFSQAVDGLAGSGGKADEVLELLAQGPERRLSGRNCSRTRRYFRCWIP